MKKLWFFVAVTLTACGGGGRQQSATDGKQTSLPPDTLNLETFLEQERMQLPLEVAPAITAVDLQVEDSALVYFYRVDEQMEPDGLEDIRANRGEIRQGMEEALFGAVADPEINQWRADVAARGLALTYRYVGSVTADTVNITFSNQELSK